MLRKKNIDNSTVVDVAQFPLFYTPLSRRGLNRQMVRYLEVLVQSKLSSQVHFVQLPSITVLANFFRCTSMDVYDALRALRGLGYEYQFSSIDGATQIWRQPEYLV